MKKIRFGPEQMRRYYNYAFNNLVNFIDPDGMAPIQFAIASEDSQIRCSLCWCERLVCSFKDTKPRKSEVLYL